MATKTKTTVIVVPGPPHPGNVQRADTGFVRFGAPGLGNDFDKNTFIPFGTSWDKNRSAIAGNRILSVMNLPDAGQEAIGFQREQAANPFGLYGQYMTLIGGADLDVNPSALNVATKANGYHGQYFSTDAILAKLGEDIFVHEDGFSNDPTKRIKLHGTSDYRRLVKFDDPDYYDNFVKPIVKTLVDRAISVNSKASPCMFVDNCPVPRAEGFPSPPWDYFASELEWAEAWRTLFRRIKADFPTLKIWVNWNNSTLDMLGDVIVDCVDHVLFESDWGESYRRMQLALGWRMAQAGKGVTWQAFSTQEGFDGQPQEIADLGLEYFCAYLLTMGPQSHWGGVWTRPGDGYPSISIENLSFPLESWFGPPVAAMFELRPGLWAREFANAIVLLNTTDDDFTVALREAIDGNGDAVTSVTLAANEGAFYLRQAPASVYDRQMPEQQLRERSKSERAHFDGLSSSGIAHGDHAGNHLYQSDELDGGDWAGGTNTIAVDTGDTWCGHKIFEIVNSAMGEGPEWHTVADFGAPCEGKYLTVECFVFQSDDNVGQVYLGLDSDLKVRTLRKGDYPTFVRVTSLIPGDYSHPASNDNWAEVVFRGYPTNVPGGFRVCGASAYFHDDPDPGPHRERVVVQDERIKSRGPGAGVGGRLHLNELSGYDPADGTRARIDLLGSTEIVGLSSESGLTVARPGTLGAGDAGYQFFDTTLGQPIWWDGSAWVDATGSSV